MQLRSLRTVVLVVIVAIFLAPGVLDLCGVRSDALSGEEQVQKPVDLTVGNLMIQKFQDYFEESFKRRSGVFDVLVKSDNQLNYFFFDSVSSNPEATVVLGEQGHLIEHLYIKDANRVGTPHKKNLLSVVEKLKRLQDNLSARGIEFLLVISPNKPSFYPEILPRRFKIPGVESRFNALEFMTEELARQGVRYIDGYSFLKQKEQELKVPMFSPIGTHWNEVGGCLVASEILRQTRDVKGEERPQFDCFVEGFHAQPGYHDSDLLRLANLWLTSPFERPAPRVAIRRLPDRDARRPRLLIVGSSFCWELMRQFENSGVTESQEFLYYFHRKSRHSSKRGFNFDRNHYRADQELKKRDIVVIEINQAVLTKAGFGFPEAVLGEP